VTLAQNCSVAGDGWPAARGQRLTETSSSQGFHHRVGCQVGTHRRRGAGRQEFWGHRKVTLLHSLSLKELPSEGRSCLCTPVWGRGWGWEGGCSHHAIQPSLWRSGGRWLTCPTAWRYLHQVRCHCCRS